MPVSGRKKKLYLIIILSIAVISVGIALTSSFIVSDDTRSFSFLSRAVSMATNKYSRACERCRAIVIDFCLERYEQKHADAGRLYPNNMPHLALIHAYITTTTDDPTTEEDESLCAYCNFSGRNPLGIRIIDKRDKKLYDDFCPAQEEKNY